MGPILVELYLFCITRGPVFPPAGILAFSALWELETSVDMTMGTGMDMGTDMSVNMTVDMSMDMGTDRCSH